MHRPEIAGLPGDGFSRQKRLRQALSLLYSVDFLARDVCVYGKLLTQLRGADLLAVKPGCLAYYRK